MSAALQVLQAKIDAERSEIADCRAAIADNETRIEELEGYISASERNIGELQAAIDMLTPRPAADAVMPASPDDCGMGTPERLCPHGRKVGNGWHCTDCVMLPP